MKKYKIFIAYFSLIFSCFAYAGLIPVPVLPTLVQPSLSESNLGDAENPGESSISSAPSQEITVNKEDMPIILRLLQAENFVENLVDSMSTLMKIGALNSEKDISEFLLLFYKIVKQNPQTEDNNFRNLYLISYQIFDLLYNHLSSRKEESLFLLLVDSVLRKFPDLKNIGACVLSDFYFNNSTRNKFGFNSQSTRNKFGFNSQFSRLLSHIRNEKTLGKGKIKTNDTSRYFANLYDAKYLEEIITLQSLLKHMLNKGDYLELREDILKNLDEDKQRIATNYPQFFQNLINFIFILLEAELNTTPSLEQKKRIADLLTIAKSFSRGTEFLYFNKKILELSDKTENKELKNFIKFYGHPSIFNLTPIHLDLIAEMQFR